MPYYTKFHTDKAHKTTKFLAFSGLDALGPRKTYAGMKGQSLLRDADYQAVENDSEAKRDNAKQEISNFPYRHPNSGIPRANHSLNPRV